jgi:hypothetical protein
MSNGQPTEQEQRALENLAAEFSTPAGRGPEEDSGQLCEKYRKVRPFIEGALTFIEKIPIYGKAIAGAIRLLLGIADMDCPQT